ncbi:hypothetical protein [Pseudonocardia nigra]|uniref:hypothetical protein n=1 Tax=Pseudonocardia nigra TaxID=1921578 RepID=UPI001C5FE5A1|nr:hypothetical protein [Pseudonocardia nigra]
MAATPASPAAAVILVPGLRDAPAIGSGCCVITPDDRVRDEIDGWPGLSVTEVDLTQESLTVTVAAGAHDQLDDALTGLRDLGFSHVHLAASPIAAAANEAAHDDADQDDLR